MLTYLYVMVSSYLTTLKNEEEGQGMAEYGLILAGIAVIVLVAVFALGDRITALMDGLTFEAP